MESNGSLNASEIAQINSQWLCTDETSSILCTVSIVSPNGSRTTKPSDEITIIFIAGQDVGVPVVTFKSRFFADSRVSS